MTKSNVTADIFYVGANDKDLDLFEGQYVVPKGVSYNSYVIMDEKIAIMDMVDQRKAADWFVNLESVLGERKPDYLVVSHLEPDHSANLQEVLAKYPDIQVVSNAKLLGMLPQFFDVDLTERSITVKEGDTLELGRHTLHFVMAPMVHWPEVMVTYDSTDKILFSADGFGKFGALDEEEEWADEARRYYFNIVGKYGMPVQTLLKKASSLDIQIICPLHGPVLSENLDYYLDKYRTWSSYKPEKEGVFIAFSSLHGNTAMAARKLAEQLQAKGVEKVVVADLAREDMAECVANAFCYDRLVVAAPTYDGGLMPVMEDFLYHLKMKAYQNRKVAIMENGSWAPMSGKLMKEAFDKMKDITVLEDMITIRSTVKEEDINNIERLAQKLV
ncbi:MAG: FprA family A-type flavoprotein [Lachnospiraceae bacterium]|nr:FprA family A-type flavoprotein [Lachnospiraceae bacterium]